MIFKNALGATEGSISTQIIVVFIIFGVAEGMSYLGSPKLEKIPSQFQLK